MSILRSLLSGSRKSILCVLWLPLGLLQAQDRVAEYRMRIVSPKGEVSGICVVRTDSAGGAMSVVNEFGIKAFDATYTRRRNRVRLCNVFAPLDKWYIRRVLAVDMSLVFDPERALPCGRVLSREEDGSMSVINKRFDIKYYLQPIDDVTE